MNEQYIKTYCGACKESHRPNEHKEESWLSAFTAGIACIIIIGLIWVIAYLATKGAY